MDRPHLDRPLGAWRTCLAGLLVHFLLALCFFSYMRLLPDGPAGSPSAPRGPVSTTGSPTRHALLILLWTWPFHNPVVLPHCSQLLPATADCQLTADRNVYPRADVVIFHHREISQHPSTQLPGGPRPPGQRWVWFSMESPSHCPHLEALDGYFNLTMSYRSDSDVFTPYGWLEPLPGWTAKVQLNLSSKTELVAWVVSDWNPNSARVRYFQDLRGHLQVDVYGRGHRPLSRAGMRDRLARYKFYLAFENSLHRDYITEKLWKNALEAWAVPVVLGPSRPNYERFLPPDAFIHVDDFAGPGELARYLRELDADEDSYGRYFRWRQALQPHTGSWALSYCKACRRLQEDHAYRRVPSIASWFT